MFHIAGITFSTKYLEMGNVARILWLCRAYIAWNFHCVCISPLIFCSFFLCKSLSLCLFYPGCSFRACLFTQFAFTVGGAMCFSQKASRDEVKWERYVGQEDFNEANWFVVTHTKKMWRDSDRNSIIFIVLYGHKTWIVRSCIVLLASSRHFSLLWLKHMWLLLSSKNLWRKSGWQFFCEVIFFILNYFYDVRKVSSNFIGFQNLTCFQASLSFQELFVLSKSLFLQKHELSTD